MTSIPVAIVTGANRNPGIGYEIVRGLAREMPKGTVVVLTARERGMGESAVDALVKEGLNVVFHQLDIADAASVDGLKKFIVDKYGGVDVLVNNAGLAFPMESKVPFPEQARQTIDVNYYGTKRMMQTFMPLLKHGGRMVGVSSTSGQMGKSWSAAMQERLLTDHLTVQGLDAIAEEFVAAAAENKHREQGFPGTAYGTSKALMTQLHRVIAKEVKSPPGLVASLCPGLCRTYMATGRGTIMSNVLWLASFVVGNSAAGGSDTPVWLCCQVSESDRALYHGKFLRNRQVQSY